jgi:hypothetical protein
MISSAGDLVAYVREREAHDRIGDGCDRVEGEGRCAVWVLVLERMAVERVRDDG